MTVSAIEIEVRGVRVPTHEALPASVIVGPRGGPGEPSLAVRVGAGDAHLLVHELRGQETTRSQDLDLTSRLATAMGGRVVAACLLPAGAGILRAVFEVETGAGLIEVASAPGQALAAAICLGVPLLAAPTLFVALDDGSDVAPLSSSVAGFLQSLDLSGLDDATDEGGLEVP